MYHLYEEKNDNIFEEVPEIDYKEIYDLNDIEDVRQLRDLS
jgi:hypothetical protein